MDDGNTDATAGILDWLKEFEKISNPFEKLPGQKIRLSFVERKD